MIKRTWWFSDSSFDDILRLLNDTRIEGVDFDLSGVEFDPADEKLLIHRCLMGDHEAFAGIVHTYEGMVFNLSYRLLGNAGEAEELAQEVFLRVFRHLNRFKGKSTLKTWIYRITLNTAYNRSDWLKRRRHRFHESLDGEKNGSNKPLRDRIESRNGNPEKLSLSNELQNLIQHSLDALPRKLRMAVVLRDIEGINYEDIATILNINIGTVKSRIARGRIAMREYLKDYIEK